MKITVFGCGYVGLVSGACFAQMGNQVVCLDVDEEKIRLLNDGDIPIHEPGLEDLVAENVEAGRLAFTTDIERAVGHGALQFIAVGTPDNGNGEADLKYVLEVAETIGRHMDDYKVIIDKSTVPVGTAGLVRERIESALAARGESIPFSVVSNPEFLKEGAAVNDFMKPHRIVVGTDDARAVELMRAVYAPINRNHEKLMVMDTRSAELTKYAANAMLATRISFMNEMANLAESLGADIEMVRRGIGSDPRIGYDFLYSGCGYGGSCFPKDIKALMRTAESEAGMKLQVVSAVDTVNRAQKQILGRKIKHCLGEDLTGRRFAIWGLAFKPNTDDIREAPSRALIDELLASGATVSAYDPVAVEAARRVYNGEERIRFSDSPMAALDGADALAIVTEWTEFRSPDFAAVRERLKQPLIFDGRNLYDPAQLKQLGFEYHPIGRRFGITI